MQIIGTTISHTVNNILLFFESYKCDGNRVVFMSESEEQYKEIENQVREAIANDSAPETVGGIRVNRVNIANYFDWMEIYKEKTDWYPMFNTIVISHHGAKTNLDESAIEKNPKDYFDNMFTSKNW